MTWGIFCIVLIFLVVQAIILLIILRLSRSPGRRDEKDIPERKMEMEPCVSDILRLEFEYARTTASEAMRDRHTMMNYYLLVVGIISTGVIGILKEPGSGPKSIGTLILWVLCCVGWFYFLKLVRLRLAWYDSAMTMNRIKDFYIEHSNDPRLLSSAFRWRTQGLPSPEKPWTVYFLSAMLIGFLDSIAYMAGGILLSAEITEQSIKMDLQTKIVMPVSGLAFFILHIFLYFKFLRQDAPNN